MRHIVPIFHARVDAEGKLVLLDAERQQRRAYLRTLTDQPVEIVIRRVRRQRSHDQSAYLHAVPFLLLAEEWGEDLETTKLLVLGECFGWRDLKDGHRLPLKPSSSNLTVEECSQLIEWLPPWALTQFNVRIPLPGDAEAA